MSLILDKVKISDLEGKNFFNLFFVLSLIIFASSLRQLSIDPKLKGEKISGSNFLSKKRKCFWKLLLKMKPNMFDNRLLNLFFVSFETHISIFFSGCQRHFSFSYHIVFLPFPIFICFFLHPFIFVQAFIRAFLLICMYEPYITFTLFSI